LKTKSLTSLVYDPSSPSGLSWTKRISIVRTQKTDLGFVAGSIDGQGYWNVGVDGRYVKAHRLIWEMFNPKIKKGMQIDHIDGNRKNNILSNLRIANQSQNSQNSKGWSKRSLPKNVFYHKHVKKFYAEIMILGKRNTSKYFKTWQEAHAWAISVRPTVHVGFCNHGKQLAV